MGKAFRLRMISKVPAKQSGNRNESEQEQEKDTMFNVRVIKGNEECEWAQEEKEQAQYPTDFRHGQGKGEVAIGKEIVTLLRIGSLQGFAISARTCEDRTSSIVLPTIEVMGRLTLQTCNDATAAVERPATDLTDALALLG